LSTIHKVPIENHKWLPKATISKSNPLISAAKLLLNQRQLAKQELGKERAKEKL
jgi:hypothetical protein